MKGINLNSLKVSAQKEVNKAKNLEALQEIYKKYLGKKGKLALILRSLKNLPPKERKKLGSEANQIKLEIAAMINEKKSKIQELTSKTKAKEWFDITAPGKKIEVGHLHPLTLIRRKSEEIFEKIGFSIVEGPEIETEWYNFDALNIPAEHPARDMWSTLWLQSNQKSEIRNPKSETNPKSQIQNSKLLLRTHTSPVQVRYMEQNNPPLRIICPGRVFRHEATDASHETNFYQLEGLMVDRNISVANLKAVVETFLKQFFGKETKIRWRPGYFPFVEPGLEADVECGICKSKGCPSCKKTGWVEIMGAGMVHPSVFKSAGLIPSDWQGFAFGIGLDRLAMLKFKINDIRLFYSGDLRFLNQF